jgi:hypothetical protein
MRRMTTATVVTVFVGSIAKESTVRTPRGSKCQKPEALPCTATACLESPAFAGPSMEAVVQRENLKTALAPVKRNKGAAGLDGMSVNDFVGLRFPKAARPLGPQGFVQRLCVSKEQAPEGLLRAVMRQCEKPHHEHVKPARFVELAKSSQCDRLVARHMNVGRIWHEKIHSSGSLSEHFARKPDSTINSSLSVGLQSHLKYHGVIERSDSHYFLSSLDITASSAWAADTRLGIEDFIVRTAPKYLSIASTSAFDRGSGSSSSLTTVQNSGSVGNLFEVARLELVAELPLPRTSLVRLVLEWLYILDHIERGDLEGRAGKPFGQPAPALCVGEDQPLTMPIERQLGGQLPVNAFCVQDQSRSLARPARGHVDIVSIVGVIRR